MKGFTPSGHNLRIQANSIRLNKGAVIMTVPLLMARANIVGAAISCPRLSENTVIVLSMLIKWGVYSIHSTNLINPIPKKPSISRHSGE